MFEVLKECDVCGKFAQRKKDPNSSATPNFYLKLEDPKTSKIGRYVLRLSREGSRVQVVEQRMEGRGWSFFLVMSWLFALSTKNGEGNTGLGLLGNRE